MLFYTFSLKHKKTAGSVAVANNLKRARRFKTALSPNIWEYMKRKKYAKNSNRKSRWVIGNYVEWRSNVIETVGVEFCDSAILNSDIMKPRLLNQIDLCQALCKFATETQTKNETDYQPSTLRDIITAIQMHLHSNKIYWKLLPKEGGPLEDLFFVVDN